MAIPPLKESALLSEVYELYGIVVHHCFNIEKRIVSLLLYPKWSKEKTLTVQQIEEIYNKLDSKTLGQLKDECKKCFENHEKIEDFLEEVLNKRNYIIHDFWGIYGWKMHQEGTLKEMVERLKEDRMFFQNASLYFKENLEELHKIMGLEDKINEYFNKK